ncbi:hypothetical protein TRFO_13758 [Tritrichomonas foetus]|uniref:Uncharacterized protein n=1 Tax=Tritrichomonas foetus TaxID=1144522 RepID=A0A1J4L1K7_9EUKA|nr:hypothetical protein TRFO_13758 [Tritrichomonas foetus]|eukprot:OHT15773.1 hypothetical protein TRFO_13758 [Tritrichomonas foetus]
MKQRIKSFPKFLNDRFQPCVLCSFSQEAERLHPDIMIQIKFAWKKLMNEIGGSTRLVLPKFRIDINVATNEIINMRNSQPKTEPYYFLNSDPVVEMNKELPTMTILRQRLFEADFMPFHCYCDIPIAIILFVEYSESAFPSKSYFPEWIIGPVSSIKPVILRLPIKDYYSVFKDFYNTTFIPNLKKSGNNILKNFQNVRNDTWVFSILSSPSKKMIAVKYYADLKMQQKQYKEAIENYQKLYETPLGQQSKLFAILCRIMQGSRSPNLVELFDEAMPETGVIERFAINLAKFYCSRTIPIMKSILPYGKLFIVLNPFLYEQYAYLCSIRKRSYLLFYASRAFSTIESNEFEVRCLYNSWGIVNPDNFNLVSQKLMETALQRFSGADIARIVSLPLSSRDIYNPQVYQQKLLAFYEKYQNNLMNNQIKNQNDSNSIFVKGIPCGFVDTRVIKIESNGFPCAPPEGFVGYWPKVAQQLFGAFDHKRFFNYNIFDIIECATDEVITIKIFFNNRCPAFEFTNLKLLIESDCEVETFPELPDSHHIEAKFIARKKGKVEVKGIEFEYHNIKFYKLFPGLTEKLINFTVFDNCPRIDLTVEGGFNRKDIFVNEIIPITIRIRNSDMKLKYLAMMAIGNANYNVMFPQTEELLGQRFLKALDSNEEFVVRLAICGQTLGLNKLLLIFPFWSFQPPCRYTYQYFEFNVHHAPEIPLFMQDDDIFAQCPHDFTAFGFSSFFFDASKHITKLEGRNCQMKLISTIITNQNTDETSNETNDNNTQNKNEGGNEYLLPEFCLPFIEDQKDILFWYKSQESMVFVPFENDAHLCAQIENIGVDQYQITIKNICKKRIKDVKVSFVERNVELSYLFSGPAIKNIGALDVGQSYEYKFRLKLLFKEATPIIMISDETSAMIHEIVIK